MAASPQSSTGSSAFKYKTGDVILKSSPFAYVLSRDERGKRCDYCFGLNEKLLRCSQCSFAYYCDKSCQRHAWKTVHKSECENIKRVKPKEPSDTALLMGRIICKLKKPDAAKEREKAGPFTRCFEDLQSHVKNIRKDSKRMEHFTALNFVLWDFLGKDKVPPKDELLNIFGKIAINSFSICNGEMQPIGTGIYLVPSLLDHSCSPNAVVVFEGTTLILRALADIQNDDVSSIFICYIDLLNTTEERQKQLLNQYYFTCHCPKCTAQEHDEEMNKMVINPNSREANSIVTSVKQAIQQLDQLKKGGADPGALLTLCQKTIKVMEGALAPSHIYRLKVLDFALDACITLNLWDDALSFGSQTLELYQRYYGNLHPNLGIQLFKIGKIELFLGHLQKAERTLLQAEKILAVTHGVKHQLYQDLLQQVCQCQEELRFTGLG